MQSIKAVLLASFMLEKPVDPFIIVIISNFELNSGWDLKSIAITVFICLSYTMVTRAQQHAMPCATDAVSHEWLKEQRAEAKHARSGDEVIYLPITVHNVGKDDGTGHYPTLRIFESLCRLNEDFLPYNIQFFLKGIKKINRTLYYEHDNFGDGSRMMHTFGDPLTINTFVTKSAPNNACGYWHQSEDAIVVVKNCMGGGAHTWTHEVGHWLSLPHTFYGWEETTYIPSESTPSKVRANGVDVIVENANGDNCEEAGDGFCDTPPDYLSDGWNCNDNFQSLQVQKDPKGDDFRSDGSNFMSYSVDMCQSKFSDEQAEAMRSYISYAKNYFVDSKIPNGPVGEEPMTFIAPESNAKVHYQSIDLEWNHHPNATHYLVNISKFNFFVTIDYEFIVEGNKINVGDLPVDRKWYWRVKPYNPYNVCSGFTDAGGFTTYDITDVEEIGKGNFVDIYPTLITDGRSSVYLDFEFQDLVDVDVKMWSISGRLVAQKNYLNPGKSVELFEIEDVPSGMYLLKLFTPSGQLVKKITIQ